MEQRRLGNSALQVSLVGLGCNSFGWKADLAETQAIVDRALDCGITFFDTAISYGPSEEFLGTALGSRRDKAVIATKFGSPEDPLAGDARASRAYIMEAAEKSLRRLKTDWIDLYQLHYPNPLTPIDETLRALEDLVQQGKVRAIGCSNLPPTPSTRRKRRQRMRILAASFPRRMNIIFWCAISNRIWRLQLRGMGLGSCPISPWPTVY